MPEIVFQHPKIGTLTIDNGMDDVAWGYNMNTAVFPTYGGEVVQILSVYIDDLTINGTVATYQQLEAIYSFFSQYMQIATQGSIPQNVREAIDLGAYNLEPVTFVYPHRNWSFLIYPKAAPGFRYGRDVVAPTWEITAHVIDDSPDNELIMDGIMAVQSSLKDFQSNVIQFAGANVSAAVTFITRQTELDQAQHFVPFGINGEISPDSGNPDTDPFQTYTKQTAEQKAIISKYADYYNSLIPKYQQGNFESLIGAIGSTPNFGSNPGANGGGGSITTQSGAQPTPTSKP